MKGAGCGLRRCRAVAGVHLLALALAAGQEAAPAPPSQPRPGAPPGGLAAQLQVWVREFRFEGNTVFSDTELAGVVQAYTGRAITSAELQEARRLLTLHYVNAGYINSGVVLADQPVENGVVVFTVVEGRLTGVDVSGNRRLRSGYLRRRLMLDADRPLNLQTLNDRLLLLRDNPNLKRINAELRPGTTPGTGVLDVNVAERSPWHAGLQLSNDRPPSVGAETLDLLVSHGNLLGFSDALSLQYGILEGGDGNVDFSGADNIEVGYALPVTPWDTLLQAYYERKDYAVIEEPFDELDIESESSTYGVSLRHPLWRTPRREVALSLTGEHRRSRSTLLNEPFSFSTGAVEGRTVVSVLRLAAEWVERSQSQVFALRSTFSLGVDAFGATDDGTTRDGQFLSWQGQAQYIRRLGNTASELHFTLNGQWSSDPLPSLEQFSIGGYSTVRGYRENQIVRDAGLIASVEFRLPILFGKAGTPIVQLAPFVDGGFGRNIDSPTPSDSGIASVGIGLLVNPTPKVSGRLYWGYAFQDFDPDHKDLQDYGIHFKLSAFAF